MRASLRSEYGVDLSVVLSTRSMTAQEVLDLIVWLPAGSAFWRSVGGPASLTPEERRLAWVEYRLRDLFWIQAGGKKAGKRPEPPKDPEYASARDLQQNKNSRQAEAYARRQARRET